MEAVVAVEVTGKGVELFRRENMDRVVSLAHDFCPFVLAESSLVPPDGAKIIQLAGDAPVNVRWEFASVERFEAVLPELKKMPGVTVFRDMVTQFLSISGVRCFRGMDFHALKRMQLAVIPDGKGNISAIEIADNNGLNAVFRTAEEADGEAAVLKKFNTAVCETDPDVIEGFNITREDLPLLEKRAKKLKFTFSCGRDGSTFQSRRSRFSVAEKQISCTRYHLYGRQISDIYQQLLFYDAVHRDFESFEPDYLREYFHITAAEMTGLSGDLSEILSPAAFYKCITLPLNFEESILRGSGAALDSFFIAAYLRAGAAIPYPEPPRRFAGALTGAGEPGVYHQVRHCDVRSLYPSLLLNLKRSPVRDTQHIFLRELEQLRRFRLEAKDKAKSLPDGTEKQRYTALQNSFKILINSFYGYLGFAQGSFNDYTLAETVTAAGREILKELSDRLRTLGAKILEMDTDGIYFTMPDEEVTGFDGKLRSVLPAGIELEFDADFPAMYCYKAKNYALLNADGSIKVSGAALKSRALENFQRQFIMAVLQAKLHDRPEILENCFTQLKNSIISRTIPLKDLAKSEVLSDSPESYKRKQNSPGFRRSAPYELALASGKKFHAGDKVEFYVTGEKAKVAIVGNSRLLCDATAERDENTAYYLAKLEDLYQQFK